MSKNGYLEKQRFSQQFFLDTGVQMGFQKCWDYIQLVLRNPKYVNKDTFGRARIELIYEGLMEMDKLYGPAHTTHVDADVLQEKLDVGKVYGIQRQDAPNKNNAVVSLPHRGCRGSGAWAVGTHRQGGSLVCQRRMQYMQISFVGQTWFNAFQILPKLRFKDGW